MTDNQIKGKKQTSAERLKELLPDIKFSTVIKKNKNYSRKRLDEAAKRARATFNEEVMYPKIYIIDGKNYVEYEAHKKVIDKAVEEALREFHDYLYEGTPFEKLKRVTIKEFLSKVKQ